MSGVGWGGVGWGKKTTKWPMAYMYVRTGKTPDRGYVVKFF